MMRSNATKLKIFGVTAVLFSLLVAPVMAKSPPKHRKVVQSEACDPRDPGNPFSQKYDFEAWSAWRRRGGWDTRAEWTCQPIPDYARNKNF
jgi:hypothetical protein